MAKESRGDAAAKKVQRAAKTAGQRDKSLVDRMGFASIVGLVCVLGVGLVTFAKVSRAADGVADLNQEHWYAAYAIWDCSADDGAGAYLPAFAATEDPDGIHPDQDGLIYVNPFYGSDDGGEATMSVFFESSGIEEVDGGIKLADGTELSSGTDCGGEEATFEIRKWPFPWEVEAGDPQVFTEGLGSIPFSNDGEVYQFVLAPADADVPPIPEDRLAALSAASPDVAGLDPNVDTTTDGDDGADADGGDDGTDADGGDDGTDADGGDDGTDAEGGDDGADADGGDDGTDADGGDDGTDADGGDDGTDAEGDADGTDADGGDDGTDAEGDADE